MWSAERKFAMINISKTDSKRQHMRVERPLIGLKFKFLLNLPNFKQGIQFLSML
jgi:hypothetical protein